VRVEPKEEGNSTYFIISEYIALKFKARKLLNTDSWFDWWDKSDPYLKFLKIRSDNSFIEAQRTEIVMDNLNPNWKNILIEKNKLIR
jgi:hypothetical protein